MKLRKPLSAYRQASSKYGSPWNSYKGKGSIYGGSAGKLAAMRQSRIAGKGRFGKRPPSFTIAECVGPAIDSEDSGFGCDFHSSESQHSQVSWCNEDSSKATTNHTTSIQHPIFSLSSKTLSNSNLNLSGKISTSSNTAPSSGSSYTIPQFSTSSPDKEFLTNLLNESLAQEDAIDHFDKAYYTVGTTGVTTSITTPDAGTSSSSPTLLTVPQESSSQPSKVLVLLPGNPGLSSSNQPLDFTQVFSKLSSTAPAIPTLVNTTVLNDTLQNKSGIQRISTEQPQPKLLKQSFTCDSKIINIDQTSCSSMKLPADIINDESSNKSCSFAILSSTPMLNGELSNRIALAAAIQNSGNGSSLSPTNDCSLNELTDILIESSREATQMTKLDAAGQTNANPDGEAVVAEAKSVDPMLILSQAVTLQKELFEEPALDGIPITGKSANITGFGFPKGLGNAQTTGPSLKGLIVESVPATNIVNVVPQQTQQVLSAQSQILSTQQAPQVISPQQTMKFMQLTEKVRMSPDSTDPGMTLANTLPFSSHQGARPNASSPMATPLRVNSISPTSTTSPANSSPIPLKRPRYSFPAAATKGLKLRNQNHNQNSLSGRSVGKRLPPGTTPTLASILTPYSRDGRNQLQIVAQPEEQHRARYQTEGSRGAIKDRKGNGFPTIKLVGYDKPATLQIFIGTDQGKVSPHMFYQACKVTGKSSTPCIEKKVEGTIMIEIEFEPSKEMIISCDCVGILKERNVDVEQRFPFHHASQSRKKSTKCRMVFRTTVINADGMEETLQVSSLPILCTQPPGVPEICKQSLTECPAKGGLELFIIGKNFLKDTRVVFQYEDAEGQVTWEASAEPLKDYLQQNHLVCAVPAYNEEKIMEPVECKLLVVSGGKHSEPHRFMYLPEISNAHFGVPPTISTCVSNNHSQQQQASPVIQATMVQQITNGQELLPVDLQTVTVSPLMQARDNTMVESGIVSSPSEVCSPVSLVSDGSMCSPVSMEVQSINQPSPPMTTSLTSLATLGSFQSAPLIQVATTQDNQAPNNFQTVLQVVQQQNTQNENKAVADLIKTEVFPSLRIQEQKTIPTNSIPLDLQFPTQDMPAVTSSPQIQMNATTASSAQLNSFVVQESTPMSVTNNLFQSNNTQMTCVTLPQIMNGVTGMSMNGTIAATSTAPGLTASITVPPSQQQPVSTGVNDVIMASTNPSGSVVVTALSVADCLGQAIIKAEPMPTLNTGMRLAMSNNVLTTPAVITGPTQNTVMGLIGGDLQPHQGPLANALSQMTDNELINYINPNCFESSMI